MACNDGGPAFPCTRVKRTARPELGPGAFTEATAHHEGLSLRDYFAAKAMQADLEYQGLEGREDLPHVAAMAYYMADAMLKAREAK